MAMDVICGHGCLNFLMTRDAALADALYEDFFVNSPFAIAKTTVFGTLIWLLLAAPVAGEAGARDVSARMYPLLYTARLGKGEYLGGRFCAALVLNALILLGAQLGIVAAVYSPGVAPALIGPARPAGYLAAYGIIALPTAFAATAVQFALAVRTGRAMAGYVGSLLLIFMGFFVGPAPVNQAGCVLDPLASVHCRRHARSGRRSSNTRLSGWTHRGSDRSSGWRGIRVLSLVLRFFDCA